MTAGGQPGETWRPKAAGYLGARSGYPTSVTTMSYHRNALPMGDVASAAKVAATVTSDPYFGEAVCRIDQLAAIESGSTVPTCVTTRSGIPGGVGLRRAMPALRFYVEASKRPGRWPLFAALAAAVGVPMAIGYALGRRK